MGKYEDLEKLQKLKDNGTINEDEFNSEKAKILAEQTIPENNTTNTNTPEKKHGEMKYRAFGFLLVLLPVWLGSTAFDNPFLTSFIGFVELVLFILTIIFVILNI